MDTIEERIRMENDPNRFSEPEEEEKRNKGEK